jgi:hypothetical protein
MNNELERIWKDAAVIWFTVILGTLLEVEKNHEKLVGISDLWAEIILSRDVPDTKQGS